MAQISLNLKDIGNIKVEEGTTAYEIIEKYYSDREVPIILAKLNNDHIELREEIHKEGNFEPIDISTTTGNRTYFRTLQFVFIKAAYELFPGCKVTIEHALDKGIYGEIHKEKALDEEDIEA